VETQKVLPIVYRDVALDCGFRVDLLVEGLVIVELQAVAELRPVHRSQVLSYLCQMHLRLGLLISFNVTKLTSGVRRVINGFDAGGETRR